MEKETMNTLAQRDNTSTKESPAYLIPVVDIASSGDAYVLEVEMPGVDKSGLELTVENGDLLIVGHRRRIDSIGEPVYREMRTNDYRRVYELDPSIDTGKINARIEQGLLTVTLPKAETVKPRKITVE
jgi:HSP20 family protein